MIARIPAIMNLRFRTGFPYNSIPFGILNTIEAGLIILALCLATLSPLFPSPARSRRAVVSRWDMESQSALRGIPLESGMGNSTLVEGNVAAGQPGASKGSKKGRKKVDSGDTLTMEGWGDGGIVKTTDVITHSQDDLGKVRLNL
jgi:hypothetical protein